MSKSEPTNWEDIDTAKVVAFVSSRINRVCNLKSPIIVHSGAVDAVAKLGREMGKQPGKDEDSRLLLNFASLDAAEILDPAREVIAFLSLNVDRYTGRTDLLQFFPAGTKSLPPMPKPENFIADITRPLIHLPLFQRHYVLFRGMVLGGRLLLEPIDKTGSFALAAMHPTRPQHSATFAAICVTFEALANCMNSFGTWLPVASALNKRVAMDPLFLDSLTYLMNLALLHYGLTVAKYMSFSAAPDDEFFDMADMVINGAFTMDPGSWIKYQKALYGKDEDKQSPAAKLRETALDVLPRLTIASRAWCSAKRPDLDKKTGKYSFAPLPTDQNEWTPIFAESLKVPEGVIPYRRETLTDNCDVCGNTDDLKRCSRCLVGRFCSVECQKEGYAKHRKMLCFDGKTARSEPLSWEQVDESLKRDE